MSNIFHLKQTKYITKLLDKFQLQYTKVVSTPMFTRKILSKYDVTNISNDEATQYRSLVAAL